MQYEIRSVEPVLNDRTILVEVAYWYFDTPIGNRAPHWVEHIIFHDIPGGELIPKLNEMGQYLGSDGVFVDPYVEVDGEWIFFRPDPGDPAYEWDQKIDDPAARIEATIQERTKQLAQQNRRGTDLFMAKPPTPKGTLNVVARDARLRALRNKRGRGV